MIHGQSKSRDDLNPVVICQLKKSYTIPTVICDTLVTDLVQLKESTLDDLLILHCLMLLVICVNG